MSHVSRVAGLTRATDPVKPHLPQPASAAEGEPEDHRCYSVLRGTGQAINLRVIHKTGLYMSFPYMWMGRITGDIEGDGDQTIIFAHEGERFEIRGRNLAELADHLDERRVRWIREVRSGESVGEGEVWVEEVVQLVEEKTDPQ